MFTRGGVIARIHDFDSEKEVYVGILVKKGKIYRVVDKLDWVRKELVLQG